MRLRRDGSSLGGARANGSGARTGWSIPPESTTAAFDQISEFVGVGKPRRKRSFSVSPKKAEALAAELAEIREAKAWDRIRPGHLVALWAWSFARTYGVAAPKLTGKEFAVARKLAAKLVAEQFGDLAKNALPFIRWVWERECEREEWRRKSGKGGGSMGWRAQFGSSSVVAEWRIAVARRSFK
jgi:hypothetical protein